MGINCPFKCSRRTRYFFYHESKHYKCQDYMGHCTLLCTLIENIWFFSLEGILPIIKQDCQMDIPEEAREGKCFANLQKAFFCCKSWTTSHLLLCWAVCSEANSVKFRVKIRAKYYPHSYFIHIIFSST